MSTLGSRIRQSREAKKMLQSELAAAVGVKSSAVISNWEQDINKPDAEKIVKLCSILDVTASYLLDYYGAEDVNSVEFELLSEFRRLNKEGQQKVLDYMRDLHATGLYIKGVSSDVSETA